MALEEISSVWSVSATRRMLSSMVLMTDAHTVNCSSGSTNRSVGSAGPTFDDARIALLTAVPSSRSSSFLGSNSASWTLVNALYRRSSDVHRRSTRTEAASTGSSMIELLARLTDIRFRSGPRATMARPSRRLPEAFRRSSFASDGMDAGIVSSRLPETSSSRSSLCCHSTACSDVRPASRHTSDRAAGDPVRSSVCRFARKLTSGPTYARFGQSEARMSSTLLKCRTRSSMRVIDDPRRSSTVMCSRPHVASPKRPLLRKKSRSSSWTPSHMPPTSSRQCASVASRRCKVVASSATTQPQLTSAASATPTAFHTRARLSRRSLAVPSSLP
mmetsp:Transcript_1150/g.3677  ORF Transcript_1150/g.3677 Transcript_1150/m.3677 type:complete len:331 (-) Transcript_1150:1071-2063(-)